jgi:hypothetical protein
MTLHAASSSGNSNSLSLGAQGARRRVFVDSHIGVAETTGFKSILRLLMSRFSTPDVALRDLSFASSCGEL